MAPLFIYLFIITKPQTVNKIETSSIMAELKTITPNHNPTEYESMMAELAALEDFSIPHEPVRINPYKMPILTKPLTVNKIIDTSSTMAGLKTITSDSNLIEHENLMPELAASEELPWTQVCTRKNPYKMPTLPKPQTVNKNNTSANTAELKEPHNNKIKELMTTVKCPLKNIMYGKKSNREIYLQKINDTALVINKIIIHTCQFLNLFLVHKFQQGHTFPEIDELCIKAIIKTITKVDHSNGGHPKQKYLDLCAQFKDFHKQHFKICDPEIVDNYKNTQILSYEAKSIVTHIKNNIEEHFFDYVNKFVNQSFNVADKIKKINEQTKDPKMVSQLRYELNTKYRKIKADLVSPSNDYVSDVKYHKWIKKHKSHILHKNTFLKDSVAYDIACNQLEYLPALFYIN